MPATSCGLTSSAVWQLLGGAGELGEHERARVVGILRGDELLGDEVHAVVERRDQPDAREPVRGPQSAPRE